jgi:hypothetical protein
MMSKLEPWRWCQRLRRREERRNKRQHAAYPHRSYKNEEKKSTQLPLKLYCSTPLTDKLPSIPVSTISGTAVDPSTRSSNRQSFLPSSARVIPLLRV